MWEATNLRARAFFFPGSEGGAAPPLSHDSVHPCTRDTATGSAARRGGGAPTQKPSVAPHRAPIAPFQSVCDRDPMLVALLKWLLVAAAAYAVAKR